MRRLALALTTLMMIVVTFHTQPGLTQSGTYTMQPGEQLNVACTSGLSGTIGAQAADLVCATLVPTATATPVPPTATATSTNTPVPPTNTAVPPTATQAAQAGQLCPASVHGAYTTAGPDGKQYPTWHPPVDAATGCYFGHEHGGDPRTANANRTMPPFGYIGALIGETEPHAGFKVFIINAGYPGEAGDVAPASTRLVFHMGTSGVARYTTRFHSMIYDYVDAAGRQVHLQGMADTGANVGSTCSQPRSGGRDFSTVGCADSYEIWNVQFKVKYPGDYTGLDQVRAGVANSAAVFDPVLTRDPADNSRILYTEVYRNGPMAANPLDPRAANRGCKRETYTGPVYWNNVNRTGAAAVYWTDAYGNVATTGEAPGLLRQEVTLTPKSNVGTFKYRQDFCDATVRAPN